MTQVISGKTELASMIPSIWSSMMYEELRNKIAFLNLFSREYEGEIRNVGDTVKVNQLLAPTGEILTNDETQFSSEALAFNTFNIVANKRASASFEITDMAQLQSLEFQAQARDSLVYAIRKQIESALIAALIPSASAPDHQIAPAVASDLNAVDLAAIRTLLSEAKVPTANRYLALAPSYYGDLLQKNVVTSQDFVTANSAQDAVVSKFMGLNIFEHDLLAADVGYAVHPSALQMVIQRDVRVKISDMHSNYKYGTLISADIIFGFTLADNKRIVKING
jgi:hypothetical protein